MRRFVLSAALGVALVCASTSVSRPAMAFERQHHLGVDLGVGILAVKDKPSASVGPGLGVHYAYGFTDQFLLMAEGSYARVSFQEDPEPKGPTPTNRPTSVWNAGAGVGYVLDVLQWVPYFGVLGGVHVLDGGTMPSAKAIPSIDLALGLDYQVSRSWALGLSFRQAFLLTDMTNYPSYTQVFARIELLWGY